MLSDVIDSFTPELYTTITDRTIGGLWDPEIALGAESNISSWMYPLNYLYLLPLNIATILRITMEYCHWIFWNVSFAQKPELQKISISDRGE